MQHIADNLYLGNLEDVISWAKNPKLEPNIIIYLGQRMPNGLCYNCHPTLIHIPLKDGKNGYSKIVDTIQIVYSIVKSYKINIMIACRAGLSRSAIITASIFALIRKIDFDKAHEFVKLKCPQILPEQNLLVEAEYVVRRIKCSL